MLVSCTYVGCVKLDILQVGLQASAWVSVGSQIGDEVLVRVEEAHPRDDLLFLKEVVIER